ncbi:MAG: hypothetical protein ACR2JX_00445 [Mycobacteriales bacterium]
MKSTLMSIIAGGVLVAACIAVPTESAVAKTGDSDVTPDASLSWSTCADAAGVQCAAVRVPVDWGQPGGDQLDLRVGRIPATDPKARIGSLLLLPGGPGEPGVSEGLK